MYVVPKKNVILMTTNYKVGHLTSLAQTWGALDLYYCFNFIHFVIVRVFQGFGVFAAGGGIRSFSLLEEAVSF